MCELNGELYSQEKETSMGPTNSPHFAGIFIARKIDPILKYIKKNMKEGDLNFIKQIG